MIIDQTLQRAIGVRLLKENAEERENHIPSGKLSASGLGKPLQWQVLKSIGIPTKQLDEYIIRKFQRGNHVEDWIISNMLGLIETQKEVEYNGVVGFADTIIDTANYEAKVGIICNEVKSVTNANFKWIEKRRSISPAHALQGALYGLSQGHTHFAITYVASDDYRILMMIEETKKYKGQIEGIILKYNQAIKNKIVPEFEAIEEWNNKEEYSDYPEWMKLTHNQIEEKLKNYNVVWPTI